ncbi:GNAT family N-acetyltransferase [Actinomadura litoris]|uniref:GNAT family N-acetyltransferase n=1 Tax=Actinomadura litoris TaxID=2678616 RepID=A0A7K1LBF8_9ACTN|nr:GNAT family N-acetyltransferase [Actinomadura litoris]MUN41653.1 GNAT family N-acetyltransferase [Actinomadura litoris]
MTADLTFTRYGPADAEDILDSVIAPVFVASHQDVIDQPFYTADRFIERFPGYVKVPGFQIVVARSGTEPVGQAFGCTLPVKTRWWNSLTTPVPDGFTIETGTRTFALNELMVIPQWQGKGVAHALHNALLEGRSEQRATLLVREDNQAAQRAYARWGWHKAARAQPFPDSPHFDVMMIDLPLHSVSATKA